MKKILIPLIIALTVLFSSSEIFSLEFEKTDIENNKAWENLLKNDFDLETNEKDIENLTAKYFIAKQKADYSLALKLCLDILEKKADSPSAAVYLRAAIDIANDIGAEDTLREKLKKILHVKKGIDPNLANNINQQLITLAEKGRNLSELKKLAQHDGWIRNWARIIGPFKRRGEYSLEKEEPFETEPTSENFTDSLAQEVKSYYNQPAGYSGTFSLYNLFYPSSRNINYRVAYAVSFVHCDVDADEIVLSIINGKYLKVWLNSELVFSPPEKESYRKPRHLIKVKLKKGINPLVVKLHANTSFGIQMFAALEQGFGFLSKIKTLSWEEGKASLKPLKNIYGFIYSKSIPEPELSDNTPSQNEKYSISKILEIAAEEEYAGNLDEARVIREKLLKIYKNSLLLKEEMALFNYRDSFNWVDSKERLQKDMLFLLKKIIAEKEDSPRAHFMEGVYLKEHDEKEEALKKFRMADKFAEKWCRPAIEAASLESELGLYKLAENYLKKAANLGQAGAYSELADIYHKQKRFSEAMSAYKKAWDAGKLRYRNYFNVLKNYSAWKEAEKIVEEFENFYPQHKHLSLQMKIDLATAQGEISKTEKLLLQKIEAFPEDTKSMEALADIYLRRDNKEKALELLKLANRIKRDDFSYDLKMLKRIRALENKTWLNAEYDAAFSDVDAEDYTLKKYPAANFAVLLRVNVCRIFPDFSCEKLVHSAVKVLTKDGMEKLAELRMPEDPDDLITCRTILPDGKIFTPTNIRRLNFSKPASMYNVVPGATLEYSYRKPEPASFLSNEFNDSFFFQNFFTPVALARYVIIIPKEFEEKISAEVLPEDFTPERKISGDNIVYIWEKKNINGIKPETAMPGKDDVLENVRIKISGVKLPHDSSVFTVPARINTNEEIKQKALELTDGIDDKEEKVKAIHYYIRKNLKPSEDTLSARDAFISASGDEKTGMQLMRAMLSAVGISANPSLADTGFERHYAENEGRTVNFRIPVLKVELNNQRDMWLRVFSNRSLPMRHSRPLDLGRNIYGSPVISHNDNGFIKYNRVYGKRTGDEPVEYELAVKLEEGLSAQISGSAKFFGATAGQLRTISDISQQGKRRIESIILSLYPKLILEKSDYPQHPPKYAGEKFDNRESFLYEFSGKVEQFCRRGKEKMSFSPFPYKFKILDMLLADRDREMDFNIPSDIEYSQSVEYSAPDDFIYSEVPESIWWQGEYGLYAANFVIEGKRLKVSRFLLIPARRIKAKNYRYFADFIEECRRTEKLAVSLSAIDKNIPLEKVIQNRPGIDIDINRFYPRYPPGEKDNEK